MKTAGEKQPTGKRSMMYPQSVSLIARHGLGLVEVTTSMLSKELLSI